MLTRHATHRMQQRAVPEMIVEILERYGSAMHHEGAEVLFIDKSARKRIAAAFGGQRSARMLEPWFNTYACISDGHVVTVRRRKTRLKRNHRRHHIH